MENGFVQWFMKKEGKDGHGMEGMTKAEQMRKGAVPLACLFFILMAYVLTGVLLFLLAFFLYRFQLSRQAVNVGVIVIYLVSTFLAGFLAGKKAGSKKFLWGFFMGVGYFLILAVISLMAGTGTEGSSFMPSFFLCALGGTLGGMVS